MELIDKAAVVAEIERRLDDHKDEYKHSGDIYASVLIEEVEDILFFLNTLEVKDVDLEKESELIANGIMISVQSNKYGTNIYNTKRNDFNHYHLQMAARKGIELGIKAQKGE